MYELTFDGMSAAPGDDTLTAFAMDTQVEEGIANKMFPHALPGSHTQQIVDHGAQGLMPLVGTLVAEQTNTIPTFTLAPSAQTPVILDLHRFQTKIDGMSAALADERAAFKLMSYKQRKTIILGRQWRTTKEVACSTALGDPSVFDAANSTALSGAAKWSDDASDPVKDVLDMKETVASKTGVIPNKMQISFSMLNRLKLHPKVIAHFGANAVSPLSTAQLTAVFELDEIVVAQGLKNTAGHRAAKSFAWLYPKGDVILFYSVSESTEADRTFGANLRWDEIPQLKVYEVQNDPDWGYVRMAEALKLAVIDRFCAHKWTGAM